jgi:hypothetical protein
MEKLIPGPADFNPVLREAGALLKLLNENLANINTALYVKGFLEGVAVCATVLMALWAFSGSRKS